jgi:hypothetical protein
MPYRIYTSAVEHSKQVFTILLSTAHESKQKPQVSGNNSSGSHNGRRGHSPPRDATRRVSATHHPAACLSAYAYPHPDSYHSAACRYAHARSLAVATRRYAYPHPDSHPDSYHSACHNSYAYPHPPAY